MNDAYSGDELPVEISNTAHTLSPRSANYWAWVLEQVAKNVELLHKESVQREMKHVE